MKAIRILGLILLIITYNIQVSLAQLGSEEAEAIERVQTRINNLVSQTDIRGATATYYWGDDFTTITSGEKKSGVPVEEDGKFMLRSFTKLLISTIILQLQEEGALSIDDEIGVYLNPINNVDARMTIRELLTMRASVCNFISPSWSMISEVNPDSVLDPETVLNELIPNGNCNSNNEYEYNDTNFQLLGLIIESVTENTGESEFESRLFSHLENHSLSLAPIDLPENELNGTWSIVNGNISDRGFDSKNSVLTTHKFNGGVVGTTKDALRLLVKILDGEIISEESLALMKDIDADGYGLGLMNRVLEGDEVYGHGGSGLHISRTFYNPELKLGVSVAANYSINQQNNAEQFLLNNYLELKTCRENGGCSFQQDPIPGELTEFNFEHDNVNRSYFVYVPDSYQSNKEWPLILNFHGYSGDVPDHIDRSRMHDLADQHGFLIAYPVGLNITRDPGILPSFTPTEGSGWSVPGFSDERDEIKYTEALLGELESRYIIDEDRVHSVGLSLGGFMAAYIATQLPDRIASFASMIGHMTNESLSLISENTQKSGVLFHGTQDIIIDYDGLAGQYPSLPTTASTLAQINNCETEPLETNLTDISNADNTTVTKIEFTGCDRDFNTQLYRINGGGHRWMGSGRTEPAALGNNSVDINASELIVEFFIDNPMAGSKSFYQRKDEWQSIVDETWGNNIPLSEKQSVFNTYADFADEYFTLFSDSDFDWDSLRTSYYDRITSDLSDGAFAGLISRFATEFEEIHARFWDINLAQGTPTKHGVPIYYYNTFDVSHFGATLVLQPDSTLLVVKTIDNHPLGIEAGDKVVGYEGKPWTELTYELFEANLPSGGFLASAPESIFNFMMTNAGINWHLFNTIDLIKFGESTVTSISLEPMFDTVPDEPVFTGEIFNNPQLPIAGIPLPNMDVFENENAITRGLIDFQSLDYEIDTESKIGYIYVTDHGYNEVEAEFLEAVNYVMTQETDGLIIDLRWNGGGYINPSNGLRKLFNEPVGEPLNILQSKVRCNNGELTDICNSGGSNTGVPGWFNWQPDPNTYYDKKIALLIGPETQSMGEYLAYQLASHPMVEIFGRPTNGGFSGNTNSGVDIGDRWEANMPNYHIVDPAYPDIPLARTPLRPDIEVWMDPTDVAYNVDTIVKTALDRITVSSETENTQPSSYNLSQNYPNPFNPSTNISFVLPEAGLVQLKVYNLLGQEVANLVDGRMNSGNHTMNFDASNLSSGVYIYRLVAGDQAITKKMMLIK